MSKGSIITLVVIVVLLLGGMFIYKQQQRSKAEIEGKQSAVQLIEGLKGLAPHREYVLGLIDSHHPEAFAASWSSGGLFAPSEFDEQGYIEQLWQRISDAARRDGKPEVVGELPGVTTNPDQSPMKGLR